MKDEKETQIFDELPKEIEFAKPALDRVWSLDLKELKIEEITDYHYCMVRKLYVLTPKNNHFYCTAQNVHKAGHEFREMSKKLLTKKDDSVS